MIVDFNRMGCTDGFAIGKVKLSEKFERVGDQEESESTFYSVEIKTREIQKVYPTLVNLFCIGLLAGSNEC